MNTTLAKQHAFISHLEKLVSERDRGALAALRRGLGKPPGTAREMDHYVLSYLPQDTGLLPAISEAQENAYYLVSALFAYWHQGKDTVSKDAPDNIGASLRLLVNHAVSEGDKRRDAEKRIEKRLVALLNSHRDDLPGHLRHTIGLLKSKDIQVNWMQLVWDVQNWQRESHDVQREWARKFWRNFQKEGQTGLDESLFQNEENTEEE